MSRKPRKYKTERIVVSYDAKRCIHAAECVRGSGEVFDPERRPWIDPAQAAPDRVAEVVVNCPTGALRFERRDSGTNEIPPEENIMRVVADGPLFLHGRVKLRLHREEEPTSETRLALCRCGASQNKPFCDNSHLQADFKDAGRLGEGRLVETEGDGEDLEVSLATQGPILIRGSLQLVDSKGERSMRGTKGALCRCGASQRKPFCDGSHTVIGFEAS